MLRNVPPTCIVAMKQEEPGHVEERQRVPEPLVLRELPALDHREGGPGERLVGDEAALGVGGRAGRVHQHADVADPRRGRGEAHDLGRHGVGRREERVAVDEASGDELSPSMTRSSGRPVSATVGAR